MPAPLISERGEDDIEDVDEELCRRSRGRRKEEWLASRPASGETTCTVNAGAGEQLLWPFAGRAVFLDRDREQDTKVHPRFGGFARYN